MENNIIDATSFIKSSRNRPKVVLTIGIKGVKTPSEISKETGIRLNYVSAILAELKDKNIVKCLNENSKRGRLYKLTKVGSTSIKFLNV